MGGQSQAQATFPSSELQEDFALLRSAITEAHAGLFVHQSPQAMAAIFDSAFAVIRDTSEIGFYGIVAGVLAQIRDGHTRSLPSERWMTWYADSARVLPLRIKVREDRGWVMASADGGVEAGAEILAIDGRTIDQVATRIRSRLPADGYIDTGTLAELNARFELWYYLFGRQADSFRVTIRDRDGVTATVQLAAVAPSRLPPDTGGQHAPLSLTFHEHSTVALLRISSFAADEITTAGLDYARFLDSAFASIHAARVADLILDLRGNDGGRDTYGSMLLSHLSTRPFVYYRSLETRTDHVNFWRHTNVDSAFNTRFGAGLVRTARGTYRLPSSRHPNLGTQQPRPPVFTGRVWILIDGGTFSTAAEFCAVTMSLGRATFLGQETGGTYEGDTSGTLAILTLPRTGVRVLVPLVRYHLAVKPPPHPGRGVIPDHPVESTGVAGDESVLEQALHLIREARGR